LGIEVYQTIHWLSWYYLPIYSIIMATDKKYWYAVGRRKMSTAIVRLFPKGKWEFIIKKWDQTLSLKEYFGGHAYLIEDALMPFTILGNKAETKYDAEIVVKWWGMMGTGNVYLTIQRKETESWLHYFLPKYSRAN